MNPLFHKVDVFTVIEHQKQGLKDAFQSVTNTELDAGPVAVAAKLIEQFGINVPVLEEETKYAVTKEAKVDVSHDPTRFIRDRSQPFYVGGTEVRIVIPFRGDAPLFDVQPTMFTLNPPFGEIHGNELHLVYVLARSDFDVEAAANRTAPWAECARKRHVCVCRRCHLSDPRGGAAIDARRKRSGRFHARESGPHALVTF